MVISMPEKTRYEFVHSEFRQDSVLVVEHPVFSEDVEGRRYCLQHYPGRRTLLVTGGVEMLLDGLEAFDFGDQVDVVLLGVKPGQETPNYIGFAKVEVHDATVH